jgi:hypothetical protein
MKSRLTRGSTISAPIPVTPTCCAGSGCRNLIKFQLVRRYTRLTTPNPIFPTNQIIHLRLLRENPF